MTQQVMEQIIAGNTTVRVFHEEINFSIKNPDNYVNETWQCLVDMAATYGLKPEPNARRSWFFANRAETFANKLQQTSDALYQKFINTPSNQSRLSTSYWKWYRYPSYKLVLQKAMEFLGSCMNDQGEFQETVLVDGHVTPTFEAFANKLEVLLRTYNVTPKGMWTKTDSRLWAFGQVIKDRKKIYNQNNERHQILISERNNYQQTVEANRRLPQEHAAQNNALLEENLAKQRRIEELEALLQRQQPVVESNIAVVNDHQAKLATALHDKARLEEQLQRQASTFTKELEAAQSDTRAARQAADEARRAADAARRELTTAQQASQLQQEAIVKLTRRGSGPQNVNAEFGRLEAELEKAKEANSNLQQQLEAANASKQTLNALLDETSRELEQQKAINAEQQRTISSLQETLQKLGKKLGKLFNHLQNMFISLSHANGVEYTRAKQRKMTDAAKRNVGDEVNHQASNIMRVWARTKPDVPQEQIEQLNHFNLV